MDLDHQVSNIRTWQNEALIQYKTLLKHNIISKAEYTIASALLEEVSTRLLDRVLNGKEANRGFSNRGSRARNTSTKGIKQASTKTAQKTRKRVQGRTRRTRLTVNDWTPGAV